VPVDAEQVEIARSAWRKYGKGRSCGGLNTESAFYALAKFIRAEMLDKKERIFGSPTRETGSDNEQDLVCGRSALAGRLRSAPGVPETRKPTPKH